MKRYYYYVKSVWPDTFDVRLKKVIDK